MMKLDIGLKRQSLTEDGISFLFPILKKLQQAWDYPLPF